MLHHAVKICIAAIKDRQLCRQVIEMGARYSYLFYQVFIPVLQLQQSGSDKYSVCRDWPAASSHHGSEFC